MATGIGGELLWLCPSLGGDDEDLTGLNTVSVDGGLASIAETGHGGTRAYSLDGIADCITVPHHSRFNFGTGDFSISLHVKPTTSQNDDLVHKIESSGSFAGFAAQRRSTTTGLWVYNNSGNIAGERPAEIDVWSHVIFARVGGQRTVWVDGKCLDDNAAAQDVDNTQDIKIGSLAAGGWGGGWYTGLIDDLRIFGRDLTPLERGQLSTPGFQPPASGSAGFTGIRGLSRRLGT